MGEYHQVLPAADELLKDAEGRPASADVMYLSRNSKSCCDCKLSCVPVGSRNLRQVGPRLKRANAALPSIPSTFLLKV